MGCGVAFMKFTLIFTNIIFLLIGLAGTGVGIWVAVDHSSLFEIINYSTTESVSLIQHSAYIFIAGSVAIVLVAILGIAGACTQNKCLLGVYAAIVILIFTLELAALITVVVFDQKFRTDFEDGLRTEFKKSYNNASNEAFGKAMDELQREFQCCGVTNVTDYSGVTIPATKLHYGYPKSCYPADDSPQVDLYTKGCYTRFRDLIKKYAAAIIGIVVAVLVFQLILFVFAVCLTRHDEFGNKMV